VGLVETEASAVLEASAETEGSEQLAVLEDLAAQAAQAAQRTSENSQNTLRRKV
jgi:hypothetical protein